MKEVQLRRYQPEDREAIEKYVLTNSRYTAHPSEKVKEMAENPHVYPLVIWNSQQQIVGFFCLHGYPATVEFSENPKALLLRTLSTDERHRGQGYGKAGMLALRELLARDFPECDEVNLAVNQQNKVAQQLYLALGFQDTGKRLMGPLGEQFVYRKGY